MTFPRIRAPGLWTDSSVVTPTEFETFDQNLSRALDGNAGGSYAPSSALIIGGSGLQVTGPFSHSDQQWSQYKITGTGITPGSKFTLTESLDVGGFNLVTNEVEVPEAGTYLVLLTAPLVVTSSTSNPAALHVAVQAGSTDIIYGRTLRFSADTGHDVPIGGSAIVVITTPSTQKLKVIVHTDNVGNLNISTSDPKNQLVIVRLA